MILDYEYPVVYFNGDDYEDSDVINKAGQIELLQISQEPYEAIVNAEGYSFHILFGSKTGGNFLCIPGWRMGCELSYLSDVFWNQREYSRAAEPPVRGGVSHLSRRNEPL